jgi:4-hydroxybenzoate polyprenyltransferase
MVPDTRPSRWQLACQLARASNLPTVWSNVLAGWILSGQPLHWGLAFALVGGSLVYAGGCTLNDAFDARWDRLHRPTRAIPSGAMTIREVWALGSVQLTAGTGFLLWAGANAWLVAALVAMILLYDWCHKRNVWAVVAMGLCRVFLGWSAASILGVVWPPDQAVALWLTGLMAYIIGLTLVARREATGGGVSWLGVALCLVPLVTAGLLNRLLERDFRDYLFVVVIWGIWFREVWMILRRRVDSGRIGAAVARLLAGIIVVDFLFVAQHRWSWGVLWLGLVLAAVVWQRRVAAT